MTREDSNDDTVKSVSGLEPPSMRLTLRSTPVTPHSMQCYHKGAMYQLTFLYCGDNGTSMILIIGVSQFSSNASLLFITLNLFSANVNQIIVQLIQFLEYMALNVWTQKRIC